jgi:hypothetical protein
MTKSPRLMPALSQRDDKKRKETKPYQQGNKKREKGKRGKGERGKRVYALSAF